MIKPNYTVLIFEDDRDLALQWKTALEAENLSVRHAAHIEEAKAYCQQQIFDLIICDVFIQDMNGLLLRQGGFSFLHFLRGTSFEHRPEWGASVPVVVVSGAALVREYSFLEFTKQFTGVTALKKPIEPESLVTHILDQLTQKN